jgi:hypothetical protein
MMLLSAQVIVSGSTGASRARMVEQLARALGPVTVGGRIELVEAHEPAAVAQAVQSAPPGTLIDSDPARLVDDDGMRPLVGPMHQRHLSNALKHHEALRRIAATAGTSEGDRTAPRFALVLEDDAVFVDGQMQDALRRAVDGAPADAGIVFLGLPSLSAAPASGDDSRFEDPLVVYSGQVLPACDSYLVTPGAAAALAAAYLPVRLAGAAAQLTYLLRRGVTRAVFAAPNAVVDGSKVGVATSSLNSNNRLLWNQPYCRLDEIVRRGRTLACEGENQPYAGEAEFAAIWEGCSLKEHPDGLVLLGDHHSLASRYAEAEDAYGKALEGFTRDGCIVDRSTEFMKRYMLLYKDLFA